VSNFLSVRRKEAGERGVVTASSGNHALALAHVASRMGLRKIKIFVPANADPAKVEKIRLGGIDPVMAGENFFAAFDNAQACVRQTGACYLHSHADPLVIAGQGTIGLEIVAALPDVDAIVVPIGGGGLISGIASAVKANLPEVRLIGAEPEASPGAYMSFQQGSPCERIELKPSVADGLAGGLSPFPFQIAAGLIEQVALASEEDIVAGMEALFSTEQLMVEGAAAVGLGALMAGKLDLQGKKVVLVLSGRNVDSEKFLSIIGRKGYRSNDLTT
jgi:threonine dehydratase